MTSSSIHWNRDAGGDVLRDGDLGDSSPDETTVKYCLDCDWQVCAADGHTRHARSKAAVTHHVETGHAVESIR